MAADCPPGSTWQKPPYGPPGSSLWPVKQIRPGWPSVTVTTVTPTPGVNVTVCSGRLCDVIVPLFTSKPETCPGNGASVTETDVGVPFVLITGIDPMLPVHACGPFGY